MQLAWMAAVSAGLATGLLVLVVRPYDPVTRSSSPRQRAEFDAALALLRGSGHGLRGGIPPPCRRRVSMIIAAWLIVAAVSFVSGGFAIPIGFALGLSAIEVYLAATAGSLAGLFVFLFAGDKVRARLTQNRPEEDLDQTSRASELAGKFGARGLGLVGPLFPGVSASVLLGLALDMDKASLARWMSIGIGVMFALYCGGFWLLIEVVGLE